MCSAAGEESSSNIILFNGAIEYVHSLVRFVRLKKDVANLINAIVFVCAALHRHKVSSDV